MASALAATRLRSPAASRSAGHEPDHGSWDLTSTISSEASTRASADTNLQNNINAEAATRASADTTLSASIAAETSRAQGAETTITGNLNNEITRATAAEGTKADLVKPVQLEQHRCGERILQRSQRSGLESGAAFRTADVHLS